MMIKESHQDEDTGDEEKDEEDEEEEEDKSDVEMNMMWGKASTNLFFIALSSD